jgi:hypothetical protein
VIFWSAVLASRLGETLVDRLQIPPAVLGAAVVVATGLMRRRAQRRPLEEDV